MKRMRRFGRKGFTLVELLVVISIIGLLLAILFPALAAAMKVANQMKCGANLRSIGQATKIYSSQNHGHWPTVYAYNSTITDETWGEAYTDESSQLADRGATAGTKLKDHASFKSNISAWWILVRAGMASTPVFICPRTTMDGDTTQEPTLYWSFTKIGNVSYSYQNQLKTATTGGAAGTYYGGNTNDNCDGQVVVAADRNPQREDVTDIPPGNADPNAKYDWNSPNHDFDGQNCLYADGHVDFNNSPYCGYGLNNIWIKSIYTAGTGATPGTWDDAGGIGSAPPGSSSYASKNSTCGNKNDSDLVP
jgi:prepilin-type N-terminal cleavage/methylation domain-containing protein/prepilin-type processing-associated H-X9-DG protein